MSWCSCEYCREHPEGNVKELRQELAAALKRAEEAEKNLRLETARRESAHKFIEAIEMAAEGHLPYGYTQDDITAVGTVFRLVQARNATRAALARYEKVVEAAREVSRITWQGLLDTENYHESAIRLREALVDLAAAQEKP